jgi:thiol-disulfide isomerase/thioredoxin
MNRRHVVTGVAAVAAAAAGAWWFRRAAPDAVVESLWQQRFERPDGGEPLAMASLRGRPLVINFWATWCAPCVRELPAFDQFRRAQGDRGWEVLALAIDNAKQVREFLVRVPVQLTVALAGLGGTELLRELGNTQGALPYTVLLDAAGRVIWRRLGETTRADLDRETARAT